MASLKKPDCCSACGSSELHRAYDPERWVCACGVVAATRQAKPKTGVCRGCGKARDEVPFDKHGNICKKCKSEYNRDYRDKNWDKMAEQHRASYQLNKKQRQTAVRAAYQRSPEAFIRSLYHTLVRPSRKRFMRKTKHNSAAGAELLTNIQITREFLIDLYHKQDGKCAITGIEMCHIFGNPRTISIDRIDSNQGYVEGNVHLVCQWVNLAKSKYSLDAFKLSLDAFIKANTHMEEPVDSDEFPPTLLTFHNYVKRFSKRSCWLRRSDDEEDCFETMLTQLVDPTMEWKEPQEIERERRRNERHYYEMAKLKDFDSMLDWMKWCQETRDPADYPKHEDREEDYDTVHVVYNKEGIRVWRYFFNNEYHGCPEPVVFIPWYAEDFFTHLDNALSVPAETPNKS